VATPPSPDVYGDDHLKNREHDQGVLDFHDKLRIESSPLSWIPARVGDYPALTDPVVDFMMYVTMHPQRRPSFNDKAFQIGGVARGQRIAPKLRWN